MILMVELMKEEGDVDIWRSETFKLNLYTRCDEGSARIGAL